MKTAILFAVALAAPPASAGAAPPAPKPVQDCSAPQNRQLDFWLGEWVVSRTADGTVVAHSRIDRLLDGCGIRETYDAPDAPGGAYRGTSYSAYDRNDGHWHQMYIDTHGNVTRYSGGLDGDDMVMEASGRALQRMAYRPQDDGSVRQVGTFSTDGGATWQPGYDYTYRRK